jgi:hypothetical protein
MSSLEPLTSGAEDPAAAALRRALARTLRHASAVLAALASRLARSSRPSHRFDPRVEFHAEAGAPEGALYVDGRFVGYVPGVKRL